MTPKSSTTHPTHPTIVRGLHNVPDSLHQSIVSIGNFDGVHLGHQYLLNELRANRTASEPVVVVLFEPQPNEFFNRNLAPKRLTSLHEKLQAFAHYTHVDGVVIIPFNQSVASTRPKQFVAQLIHALQPKCIWVGHDFKFGYRRSGDYALLVELSNIYGYSCGQAKPFRIGNERISSTSIRQFLQQGNLIQSKQYLGRDYALNGRVIKGDQLGRTLGYPTANIKLKQETPIQGSFIVSVDIQQHQYWGMANVGYRPSVQGKTQQVEVHIFNFNETIYQQRITITFLHLLRKEQRFESLKHLVDQLAIDKQCAQQWIATHR